MIWRPRPLVGILLSPIGRRGCRSLEVPGAAVSESWRTGASWGGDRGGGAALRRPKRSPRGARGAVGDIVVWARATGREILEH